MTQAAQILTDLNQLERIVFVSKNNEGTLHMAHSFYYGGRDGSEYLLFLYKDALSPGNFIEGWNDLDEHSLNITIVGVSDHQTAIDDFIACWNPELTKEAIHFYLVKDFSEIEECYHTNPLNPNEIIAFGILK